MTFHSLVVAHSHPDRQIHVISIGCLEDDMKISDKSKVICVYFSWKSRTNQSRCICQCYSKTTFSIRISHLNFLLLILATLGTEFFFLNQLPPARGSWFQPVSGQLLTTRQKHYLQLPSSSLQTSISHIHPPLLTLNTDLTPNPYNNAFQICSLPKNT